jgi:caffeoyl-CoA O-methyltransferase
MPILDPAVEAYIRERVGVEDEVLAAVRAFAREHRVPSISPESGQLISVLCRAIQAQRVLEIGTCTGYSGIWIARAIAPDGRLETIEYNPEHAEWARRHFVRAGVAGRVQIHQGDAKEVLRQLPSDWYDVVFIDADKEGYPVYLEQALRLVRLHGLILADNVLWQGRVATEPVSPTAAAILEFTRRMLAEPRLASTIVPVGDGLSISVRVA